MTEQQTTANLEPIPQPPPHLFVGNIPDMKGELPTIELMQLAGEYGPIYQLTFPGGTPLVIVSSFELVDELCNESRFDKQLGIGLQNAREFMGDGLFTARTQEPNWRKAHTILLPVFSMQAMKNYHPMMVDVAEQLMKKWQRMNADEEIDVTADMTRLTLDTIGLCGFDYRFNSFFRETPHPFIQSLVRALAESQASSFRLPIQDKLMIRKRRQQEADVQSMNELVDRIIKERKEQGAQAAGKKDLLNYMLNGVDKQSGEQLDDLNIRYQIITFLIAGHETTSGLLSFALYALLRYPSVLAKAYAEVDRVLGRDPKAPPTYDQVRQLTYLSQVLKESLRLWPTAPAFNRYPYADETVIGGKYPIRKEQAVMILIPMLHRDKSVWGEDAEEFDPEHFSPEAEQARPANAYMPFGSGQRACIGRQFAMQEAALALGMILQRFQLIDHKHYQLELKQTLTVKPDGFTMQVKKRAI